MEKAQSVVYQQRERERERESHSTSDNRNIYQAKFEYNPKWYCPLPPRVGGDDKTCPKEEIAVV